MAKEVSKDKKKISIWKFIITDGVLMGLFMGSRRLLKQSRVKK